VTREAESPLVTVLCRPPRSPESKTRLAAEVGSDTAAELYLGCLRGVLQAVGQLEVCIRLAVAGRPLELAELCAATVPAAELVRQRGATFAERQRHEIVRGLLDGHGVVVLVASDLLEIDAEILRWAIAAGQLAGVAIVPSPDGGYGLLGTSTDLPELVDVPMSSDTTRDSLVAALRARGLAPVVASRQLPDLDVAADMDGLAVPAADGRPVLERSLS